MSAGGGVTEATPGHDGSGVSCGNTLQDGGLVDIDGEVLRAGQDDGLLVDPGSCSCGQKNRNLQKHPETFSTLSLDSFYRQIGHSGFKYVSFLT